jgi:hypothetical protein
VGTADALAKSNTSLYVNPGLESFLAAACHFSSICNVVLLWLCISDFRFTKSMKKMSFQQHVFGHFILPRSSSVSSVQ